MPEQVTLWQDAWRRLRRNRLSVIGLVIIGTFVAVALISFVWTPYPTWRQALGTTYSSPSLIHPFGLDACATDLAPYGDSRCVRHHLILEWPSHHWLSKSGAELLC